MSESSAAYLDRIARMLEREGAVCPCEEAFELLHGTEVWEDVSEEPREEEES